MQTPTIDFDQEKKISGVTLAALLAGNPEQRAAAIAAESAMARLARVLRGRSGQPYHLRALLYSLWNGKPARLCEINSFDFDIRKDFCTILLAFGFERGDVHFFYSAIQEAITSEGQWEWFLEERFNVEEG